VAGLEVAPLARAAGWPRRTAGTVEGSAAVKKLALEKMFDNSLLQEIQKEQLGK